MRGEKNWDFINDPLLLIGFTSDGCIRCRWTGYQKQTFGDKEFVLPLGYTDCNWITYKEALKAKGNELNKWRGKKIRRIRPTSRGDRSWMTGEAPTLISASEYHMVIRVGIQEVVLGLEFVNPEDWDLAE